MLVLKNKKKTLEEIMPVWAERIQECGSIKQAMVTHGFEYRIASACLVGEAHGFNSDYAGSNGTCHECYRFSNVWAVLTTRTEQEWIDGFVEHWNTVHIGE